MTTTGVAPAVGRIIYTQAEIAAAVERLAGDIAADHREQLLVLLGVLKGGVCLVSDLARALSATPGGPSAIMVEHIVVSRYRGSKESNAPVELILDSGRSLEGANVVLVDTIVDRGLTLAALQALLKERRPATLRTCVLVEKAVRRTPAVALDYRGLAAPDAFVIGYGLDYKEWYRGLPYLAELREEQTV
ncbi:MAG: hypoxanthine phosphoribosyltransferase [Candidatus Eremiobacteraeota bacterium]|nr:hypoxanthine phosphoribosyltransferase [Candidatus Eremiobacteraeota bacterium]